MKIPLSTYRLQFNQSFTFKDAAGIVSYLSDLGISDLYASPIFKAGKGSSHGYDVTDPTVLNPELGTQEDFEALCDLRQSKGMGWLQDIVPNHMALDPANPFVYDVLEHGPCSRYFNFLDVDWEYPYPNLKGKLLIPVLGEYYGQAIQGKKIQLKFGAEGFSVCVNELQFPIKIDSYLTILISELGWLESRLGFGDGELIRFLELTQVIKDLSGVADPSERQRLTILIKSKLWNLYETNPDFKTYFDLILERYNSVDQNPQSVKLLDSLLLDQFFRLAFWKVGNEELNYRRFFTVNNLICMNIGHKDVFDHVHSLILRMVRDNKCTGLRIDHLDGIYNPVQYLKRLRQEAGDAYMVIEKILDLHEELPPLFPVEGTTGYDFLNFLNGLFVDRANEKTIDVCYERFTGSRYSYHQMVSDKKRLFMGRHMAGDIDNLAQLFHKIFHENLHGRDLTMYGIRRALVEIMAHFPVYRTYICDESIPDVERVTIKEAAVKSKNLNPALEHELNLVEKVLLLDFDSQINEKEKSEWLHFTQRFQQFSGPLMAKGAEDTTFYIYNRLLSLNEVGNDPSIFGISDVEFHGYVRRRLEKYPYSMNASATHDTKRGEDVRARLNVLSELPREWSSHIRAWSRMNNHFKKSWDSITIPDRNAEYFIYQTLLGAYPFLEHEVENFKVRLKEYIIKAFREAKVHTRWVRPELEYEQGCLDFVDRILDASNKEFLESFLTFQKKIAHFGVLNSLAQTVIKLTAPGVPDIYQGTELWDLSLVDPDNRRSVDYQMRRTYLEEIKHREYEQDFARHLLDSPQDARVKLFLIYKILNCRKQFADLFQKSGYETLPVSGKYSRNIINFMRRFEQQTMIIVASRFSTQIGPAGFEDTQIELPDNEAGSWLDVLTNRTFELQSHISFQKIYEHFPAAVLIKTN